MFIVSQTNYYIINHTQKRNFFLNFQEKMACTSMSHTLYDNVKKFKFTHAEAQ